MTVLRGLALGRLALGLWILPLWFLSGSAYGHMTSPGRVFVKIKPETRDVEVLLSISLKDIGSFLQLDTNNDNHLEPPEIQAGLPKVEGYLASKITVANQRRICPAIEQRMIGQGKGKDEDRLFFFQRRRCEEPLSELMLQITVMFEDIRGYMHYTRIQGGGEVRSTVFSNLFPSLSLKIASPLPSRASPPASSQPTSKPLLPTDLGGILLRYLWEGIVHIVLGLDHVLFVLCLLLVAQGFSNVVRVITAFTLGHSVTLILSALRIVDIPARPIEAIIALSIAYIAIENLVATPPPVFRRFWLAAGFGLIHGFGFSYVLRDELGLPTGSLLPALASFNLGVEVGQIAIVLCVYPFLRVWMQKPWYRSFLVVASSLILALALYWSIQRIFFA